MSDSKANISEIRLVSVLPEIFVSDPPKQSDVWLRDVSFRKGERYLIAANSGTGKSSLCSYIYGARHDYRGQILFDGADIAGFSANRIADFRCNSIAYLPQQLSLFPELTVMENIAIKNRLTDCYSDDRILGMLSRLGIADKAGVRARYLSIGQQQRVAIVRTLCQPFDFILLDEPVSHLDLFNNEIVAAMISEEAAARGAAIIATSVGNHLAINDFKILKL